jgi:hypothetical protein
MGVANRNYGMAAIQVKVFLSFIIIYEATGAPRDIYIIYRIYIE